MDNECVKCGRYSGGGSLCVICEKAALKKNARKPRKKKPDLLVADLITALDEYIGLFEVYVMQDMAPEVLRGELEPQVFNKVIGKRNGIYALLERVKARYK